MGELINLLGIVTAFLGLIAGMLWGIAAVTGGAGPEEPWRH